MINNSSLWDRSFTNLNEPLQAKMLETKLKKPLADQRFFRLVMVEQKKWTHALIKNHHEEPQGNGEKMASRA